MNSCNKAYGRKLIEAAISGISKREAHATDEPSVGLILKCLTGAVLGILADTHILKRPARFSRTAAYAAFGFLATLAWNTRRTTGAMTRSAAKELGRARDEHWLEMNPIDYA